MKYFVIRVNRVVIGNEPAVQEVWIRGDLVRGIRSWRKSEEDMIACKEQMTQVALVEPLTSKLHLIRIAEGCEAFSARLYDFNNPEDKNKLKECGIYAVTDKNGMVNKK